MPFVSYFDGFFLVMNSSIYLLIGPEAKLRDIVRGVDNHKLPTKTTSVEPNLLIKISLEFHQQYTGTTDVPKS